MAQLVQKPEGPVRMASKGPNKSALVRRQILLVEDNSARSHRRRLAGVASSMRHAPVTIRLHRITWKGSVLLAERAYSPGALRKRSAEGGKAALALELLDSTRHRGQLPIVTAGSAYGCNESFLEGLVVRGLDFVVEVRPSTALSALSRDLPNGAKVCARDLLGMPKWRSFELPVPNAIEPVEYSAALLANVRLRCGPTARLFVAQTGGVPGVHRGTIFGLASEARADLAGLLRVIGWARWIRPATRLAERSSVIRHPGERRGRADGARGFQGVSITARASIAIARRQDQRAAQELDQYSLLEPPQRCALSAHPTTLNVVELFAGAGGMGLGFLLASRNSRRYRIAFSGEVNPIYVKTLQQNHDTLTALRGGERTDHLPERVEPVDLRTEESLRIVRRQARQAGGLHVLIGGPPCQGFSNANRNSWHSNNPHSRLSAAFLRYVETLRPQVFLLENVQGILWAPKRGRGKLTVVEHLARRFASAGYLVFPKLLDAVWYGVPQFRSRFFLLGLHLDLGYKREDFGEWGPFPLPTHGPGRAQPFVTVRQAIGDLPRINNGDAEYEREYSEPGEVQLASNPFLAQMRDGGKPNAMLDHVTSRHADYVIERYAHIPPGGNWRDIAVRLTNYAAVERTHSNIYRRLKWSEPSITIGHYRKSMLVHPSQHRGLSLREAARLQSFPDWFRFSGGSDSASAGLVHKQQQLANAVCPLITKALAEFILTL